MRSFPALLVMASAVTLAGCVVPPSPTASKGYLDASSIDLKSHRLAINGEWEFYGQQLLLPQDEPERKIFDIFPEVWRAGKVADEETEYGTYRVRVITNQPDSLAITIPQIYCSYKLYINQQLMAVNGEPGTSKVSTKPQWLPQTKTFLSADTLTITLQIANFFHDKGGSREPIYIGSPTVLHRQRTAAMTGTSIEVGILGFLAIMFFFIFIWQRKLIVLYFSLICFVWGIRGMFSNLYLAIDAMPEFDWHLMIRIEYITLYLTMVFTSLYIHHLFPRESSKVITGTVVLANMVFIVPTIFSEAITFTRYLNIYLITSGITIFYCISTIIRAWINDRHGTTFLLGSALIAALVFTYDLLAYEGFFMFHALGVSIGYAVVFLLMAPALLIRIDILKSKATGGMLTYDDLYGKGKS